MRIRLLVVPYDSGRRDWRMGRGPLRLLGPVVERLGDDGHDVDVRHIDAHEPRLETRTAFELCRRVADETRKAREAGDFPLVLAGNCSASVGVLAGLDPGRRGIVWLDAHGDFNTPETSPSGYLDGMALAVAAGRCWTTVAGSIPGHAPIAEDAVLLVGARDLDPGERDLLESSRVARLSVPGVRAGGLAAALSALAVDAAVLHIDADVHDPARTPANTYPAPDGLFPDEVRDIARAVAARLPLAAATLAAFDPEVDESGATLSALVELVRALAAAVTYRSAQ